MSDTRISVVGIKKCGCVTSAMDKSFFSDSEVEEFIEDLEKLGMHAEIWDDATVKAKFGYCQEHKPTVQKELF